MYMYIYYSTNKTNCVWGQVNDWHQMLVKIQSCNDFLCTSAILTSSSHHFKIFLERLLCCLLFGFPLATPLANACLQPLLSLGHKNAHSEDLHAHRCKARVGGHWIVVPLVFAIRLNASHTWAKGITTTKAFMPLSMHSLFYFHRLLGLRVQCMLMMKRASWVDCRVVKCTVNYFMPAWDLFVIKFKDVYIYIYIYIPMPFWYISV